MTELCTNLVPGTDHSCGSNPDGPFHLRFCSDECTDRVNSAELREIGITPELMEEALAGYYECKSMIEDDSKETSPETE
jgi:hypothetical protein